MIPTKPAEQEPSASSGPSPLQGQESLRPLQPLTAAEVEQTASAANELGHETSGKDWLRVLHQIADRISQRRTSAFLASLVLHLVLFLILALLTLHYRAGRSETFDFVWRDGIARTAADSPVVQVLSADASPAPPV